MKRVALKALRMWLLEQRVHLIMHTTQQAYLAATTCLATQLVELARLAIIKRLQRKSKV